MRNLYRKIGIPKGGPEAIREELHNIKSEDLKKDIETVLLNSDRKKAYDRLHSRLKEIALLQSRVNFGNGGYYSKDLRNEFGPYSDKSSTALERFRSKAKKYKATYKSNQRSGWKYGHEASPKEEGDGLAGKVGVAVLAILFLAFFIGQQSNKSSNSGSSQEVSSEKKEKSPIGEDKKASGPRIPVKKQDKKLKKEVVTPSLPESGMYSFFGDSRKIAPFRIRSRSGDNFFVKMERSNTGEDIITFFVRGGDVVESKVPIGHYRMKYCLGDNFYGPKKLFGESTKCFVASNTFRFTKNKFGVNGHEVTLFKVRDGNLTTDSISRGQF